MIQINNESYLVGEIIEIDFVYVESESTLIVGVVLDKEFNAVRVLYLDLAHQDSYTREDFEKCEQLLYREFNSLDQAQEFFEEIKNPIKITHLVKKHKQS